jgi:SAM-dependent methyltransferase
MTRQAPRATARPAARRARQPSPNGPAPLRSGTATEANRSEAYRSEAGHYDRRTERFGHWRQLLVDHLPARPGDTVLDVGCGTGLCLGAVERKVGDGGTIIGIDASEQMLEVAAARVDDHGWDNVRLIAAATPDAPIDATADGALFCAVHDVLQSPAALAHVFDHLRPGAPVAAIGGKWPPLWMWPLRPWVANLHEPFVEDFTGFDRPWRLLAEHVPDLRVKPLAFGTGYLATGHARGRGPA